jgi:outer membrane protein OmpA-like peptidoglycan-associated protein
MRHPTYRSAAAKPLAHARPARPDIHTATRDANGARAGVPVFLQRALHTDGERPQPSNHTKLKVGAPGDAFEREADRVARIVAAPSDNFAHPGGLAPRHASGVANAEPSSVARALRSPGQPLDAGTRQFMETRFGADLSRVRVHTGDEPAQLNRDLGADSFTHGNDIFYSAGKTPGRDTLTAHELAHVVQQSGRTGERPIQCTFAASYQIPGSPAAFEIELRTRQGALATPRTKSGLDGYIRFVPTAGIPNSNVIAFTQLGKLTDVAGADQPSAGMPAGAAPRGALGTPGVRTAEDAARGITGGFHTDVIHTRGVTGQPFDARYPTGTAAPGTTGFGGQTQQPAQYGGGIGAQTGQTPGFKRSDDPVDMRSASMYDFPGTASNTQNLDFEFETAALGEDTMQTYGVVNWGFGLRAGAVVNEHLHVVAGQSATFGEALERHRDFYVHEPVTFYFDFDSDVLSAAEAAKIDTFTAYLARNPDVQLSLSGFADQVGGPSTYNLDLSSRRAEAVRIALLARGVGAARMGSVMIGFGASTAATTDAGTGDQGGNAAVGADQSRDANRQFNRRVILTFTHVPPAAPAPAPAGP